MDWDKLKTFHAAADTGSLTAAAEKWKMGWAFLYFTATRGA